MYAFECIGMLKVNAYWFISFQLQEQRELRDEIQHPEEGPVHDALSRLSRVLEQVAALRRGGSVQRQPQHGRGRR